MSHIKKYFRTVESLMNRKQFSGKDAVRFYKHLHEVVVDAVKETESDASVQLSVLTAALIACCRVRSYSASVDTPASDCFKYIFRCLARVLLSGDLVYREEGVEGSLGKIVETLRQAFPRMLEDLQAAGEEWRLVSCLRDVERERWGSETLGRVLRAACSAEEAVEYVRGESVEVLHVRLQVLCHNRLLNAAWNLCKTCLRVERLAKDPQFTALHLKMLYSRQQFDIFCDVCETLSCCEAAEIVTQPDIDVLYPTTVRSTLQNRAGNKSSGDNGSVDTSGNHHTVHQSAIKCGSGDKSTESDCTADGSGAANVEGNWFLLLCRAATLTMWKQDGVHSDCLRALLKHWLVVERRDQGDDDSFKMAVKRALASRCIQNERMVLLIECLQCQFADKMAEFVCELSVPLLKTVKCAYVQAASYGLAGVEDNAAMLCALCACLASLYPYCNACVNGSFHLSCLLSDFHLEPTCEKFANIDAIMAVGKFPVQIVRNDQDIHDPNYTKRDEFQLSQRKNCARKRVGLVRPAREKKSRMRGLKGRRGKGPSGRSPGRPPRDVAKLKQYPSRRGGGNHLQKIKVESPSTKPEDENDTCTENIKNEVTDDTATETARDAVVDVPQPEQQNSTEEDLPKFVADDGKVAVTQDSRAKKRRKRDVTGKTCAIHLGVKEVPRELVLIVEYLRTWRYDVRIGWQRLKRALCVRIMEKCGLKYSAMRNSFSCISKSPVSKNISCRQPTSLRTNDERSENVTGKVSQVEEMKDAKAGESFQSYQADEATSVTSTAISPWQSAFSSSVLKKGRIKKRRETDASSVPLQIQCSTATAENSASTTADPFNHSPPLLPFKIVGVSNSSNLAGETVGEDVGDSNADLMDDDSTGSSSITLPESTAKSTDGKSRSRKSNVQRVCSREFQALLEDKKNFFSQLSKRKRRSHAQEARSSKAAIARQEREEANSESSHSSNKQKHASSSKTSARKSETSSQKQPRRKSGSKKSNKNIDDELHAENVAESASSCTRDTGSTCSSDATVLQAGKEEGTCNQDEGDVGMNLCCEETLCNTSAEFSSDGYTQHIRIRPLDAANFSIASSDDMEIQFKPQSSRGLQSKDSKDSVSRSSLATMELSASIEKPVYDSSAVKDEVEAHDRFTCSATVICEKMSDKLIDMLELSLPHNVSSCTDDSMQTCVSRQSDSNEPSMTPRKTECIEDVRSSALDKGYGKPIASSSTLSCLSDAIGGYSSVYDVGAEDMPAVRSSSAEGKVPPSCVDVCSFMSNDYETASDNSGQVEEDEICDEESDEKNFDADNAAVLVTTPGRNLLRIVKQTTDAPTAEVQMSKIYNSVTVRESPSKHGNSISYVPDLIKKELENSASNSELAEQCRNVTVSLTRIDSKVALANDQSENNLVNATVCDSGNHPSASIVSLQFSEVCDIVDRELADAFSSQPSAEVEVKPEMKPVEKSMCEAAQYNNEDKNIVETAEASSAQVLEAVQKFHTSESTDSRADNKEDSKDVKGDACANKKIDSAKSPLLDDDVNSMYCVISSLPDRMSSNAQRKYSRPSVAASCQNSQSDELRVDNSRDKCPATASRCVRVKKSNPELSNMQKNTSRDQSNVSECSIKGTVSRVSQGAKTKRKFSEVSPGSSKKPSKRKSAPVAVTKQDTQEEVSLSDEVSLASDFLDVHSSPGRPALLTSTKVYGKRGTLKRGASHEFLKMESCSRDLQSSFSLIDAVDASTEVSVGERETKEEERSVKIENVETCVDDEELARRLHELESFNLRKRRISE